MSRLLPIGEDSSISSSNTVELTLEEFKFFQEWHNKILCIPDVQMEQVDYLTSKQKNTLGVTTSFYDWKMNSAGQDNIGKILLSVLSFKRLKDKYGDDYKGGILAIDELDATLNPASQLKLLEALRKFSSKYKIQIVITTHSLTMLQKVCEWQGNPKFENQIKVIYLQKFDNNIRVFENVPYSTINDNLKVIISNQRITEKKIPIFTEDREGQIFLKALIKRNFPNLVYIDCNFGCSFLLELGQKKVQGFNYLQSLIVLDGDVKNEKNFKRKIKYLKNILILPGEKSIERLLADFLINQFDTAPLWNQIESGYNKQISFKNYTHTEIINDREKAKSWFNEQKKYWGRGCTKLINLWIKENEVEVNEFIEQFKNLIEIYNKANVGLIKN